MLTQLILKPLTPEQEKRRRQRNPQRSRAPLRVVRGRNYEKPVVRQRPLLLFLSGPPPLSLFDDSVIGHFSKCLRTMP